jgi:hypothetical protein
VEKRMDGADKRVGGIEERIEPTQKRTGGIEERIRWIEERGEGAQKRTGEIEERIAGAEKRIRGIEERAHGAEEAQQRVQRLKDRIFSNAKLCDGELRSGPENFNDTSERSENFSEKHFPGKCPRNSQCKSQADFGKSVRSQKVEISERPLRFVLDGLRYMAPVKSGLRPVALIIKLESTRLHPLLLDKTYRHPKVTFAKSYEINVPPGR